MNTITHIEINQPNVNPGRLIEPLDGSKKTSRDDEAVSSNIEAKAGGSSGLPFAMYTARTTYLKILLMRILKCMPIKAKKKGMN